MWLDDAVMNAKRALPNDDAVSLALGLLYELVSNNGPFTEYEVELKDIEWDVVDVGLYLFDIAAAVEAAEGPRGIAAIVRGLGNELMSKNGDLSETIWVHEDISIENGNFLVPIGEFVCPNCGEMSHEVMSDGEMICPKCDHAMRVVVASVTIQSDGE